MVDFNPATEAALDEQEAAVRRSQLLDELKSDNRRAALHEILQLEQVRDFLDEIFDWAHMYQPSYDRNFGDMSFKEGERNIGLRVLAAICDADPEAEMKMRRRRIERERAKRFEEEQKRQQQPKGRRQP